MKSKLALSSMCRACAQRCTPASSGRTLTPLAATAYSRRATTLQHGLRSITTTATTRAESHADTISPPSSSASTTTAATTPYAPIPPSTPSNLTPPELLSLPTLLPSYPTPSYTATITSIHASTAHATRTVPAYSTHLRKSFRSATSDLVHDPYALLRVGDVIRYTPFTATEAAARDGLKDELDATRMARLKSKRRLVGRPRASDAKKSSRTGVKFVVRQVVSAFGEGLEERVAAAVEEGKAASIVAEVQRREGLLDGGEVTKVAA